MLTVNELNGFSACTPVACCARVSGPIARSLRTYLRLLERHLAYAAAHIQHRQGALTFINLQLHHVVSDVTRVTGLQIVRAIIAGERDVKVLANMLDVRRKASSEVIEAALQGNHQPAVCLGKVCASRHQWWQLARV